MNGGKEKKMTGEVTQLSIIYEIAESRAKEIRDYLDTGFEKELFDAVIENLVDFKNSLRLNNFSYAARELLRIYLNNRSNDATIKSCPWFNSETNKGRTTWADKMHYIIHKGLSPDYLNNTVGIDMDNVIRTLNKNIDILNKYTHISDTFNKNNKDNSIAKNLFHSLWDFFNLIEGTRKELCDHFITEIADVATNTFVLSIFDAIEGLATHSVIDEAYVETIDIIDFDNKEIRFEACGTVYVELQWGSNSDFKRGDGARGVASYPFSMIVTTEIGNLENWDVEDAQIHVDDESPYSTVRWEPDP
jgi:hypothetical protein